jgi:hypothetical protein
VYQEILLTGLVTSPLQAVSNADYQTVTYLINGLIVVSILSIVLGAVAYADRKTKGAGARAVVLEKTGFKFTSGHQDKAVQVELVLRNPHSVPLDVNRIYGALYKDSVMVRSFSISDNISIAPLSGAIIGKSFGLGAVGDSKDLVETQPDPRDYVLRGTLLANTIYGKSIVRFRMEPMEDVLS